jgi:hypothetical protein
MNAKKFIFRFKVAVKSSAAKLRRKQPASTTTRRRPLLAKPEPVPADPAEHAIRFAKDWYDPFEANRRKRMRELGIAEP